MINKYLIFILVFSMISCTNVEEVKSYRSNENEKSNKVLDLLLNENDVELELNANQDYYILLMAERSCAACQRKLYGVERDRIKQNVIFISDTGTYLGMENHFVVQSSINQYNFNNVSGSKLIYYKNGVQNIANITFQNTDSIASLISK